MENIKYKLLVMSGKGGVGKTTIAVNLACNLSKKGCSVGLMDVDIHGPNVPKMLNLEDKKLGSKNNKIIPIKYSDNLKVVSFAFLLQQSDAVVWRGPMKHNLINQFINDVEWGNMDFLVIDFPPGTGDEAISVSQLIKNITGSIIVSTPQQVALIDVDRSISFSKDVNIPVIGIIENMSGEIFGKGTVEDFAASRNIDYLGNLAMSKSIRESGDNGNPFAKANSEISKSFETITDKIISFCEK